jgi:hypothetical protein
MVLGAAPPVVGWSVFAFGLWLRFPDQSGSFGEFIGVLILYEALTLVPFLILALVVRWRLRKRYLAAADSQSLLGTKRALKGAVAGLAIPYTMFWLFLVTPMPFFGTTETEFDMAGMGQAFAAYLMFILPFFGLITALVGALIGSSVRRSGSSPN